MKNRKRVVVAFLLVAVLCLGIGYAALTDTLTISGTFGVQVDNVNNPGAASEWDEDIYFSAVTQINCSNTGASDEAKSCTPQISSDKDTITATIPVGALFVKDDTVTFTATVKNDNPNYVATLKNIDIHCDYPTYFAVTTDLLEGTTVDANGGTKDIVVTIKIKQTPPDTVSNVSFSIQFNAETPTI